MGDPIIAPPPAHAAAASGRSRLRWILLGVAVVLLIGGAFLWRYFGTFESTDDAQVDGRPGRPPPGGQIGRGAPSRAAALAKGAVGEASVLASMTVGPRYN